MSRVRKELLMEKNGMPSVRPVKTSDVAEYMGISERQVLRFVHEGLIPAVKVGGQIFFDPRRIISVCGMDTCEEKAGVPGRCP